MTEDMSLIGGFRCAPIPENPRTVHTAVNPYMNLILKSSEFRSWSNFSTYISIIKNHVDFQLRLQGCCSNNQRTDRCSGTFQNPYCGNEACRLVTEYKQKATAVFSTSTSTKLHSAFDRKLLPGLVQLAKNIESKWRGKPYPKPYVTLDKRFTGGQDITIPSRPAFTIQRSHETRPDVVIFLWSPNRGNLLPSLEQGRNRFSNLALAYQYACSSVTESSVLSNPQRCMGALLKAALLTRSGYGCMCTHNQAVFVKVTPQPANTGAAPRHTVYVSKEYRCDGQDVSVFHGLLAMMLLGFEHSNREKEGQLHYQFNRVTSPLHSLPSRDQDPRSDSENNRNEHRQHQDHFGSDPSHAGGSSGM